MKRLDRLKGAFLSLISHKLKTPLTSLSLGLEEMEHYAANLKPDDPCHQRLISMREDMGCLSRLLTSLLRVQQVMGGQAGPLVRCDLADVIRAALAFTEWPLDRYEVVLDLSDLPLVLADRGRLIFALQQVLDNAFKFSPEAGKITILLKQAGTSIQIGVQDAGCGISEKEMPKIFERFYQVDPDATGQVPGFGLGLFCTREIARQHGGSVTVTSKAGKGTQVTISLPYPTPPACQTVKNQMLVGGYALCELLSEGLVFLPA